MPISRNRSITAGACIALALGLLILPLRWLLASLVAAAFHEFCHLAAIRLCGGKVTGFSLDSGGAVITADQLSRGAELLCALAGPLGGALMLLTARWMPAVAVCAAAQSAYNLLPVFPLDGGRAFSCAAKLLLPPKAARYAISAVEWGAIALIGVGAVYASFRLRLGIMPILLSLAVIVKAKSGKIPCKPERQRVQ